MLAERLVRRERNVPHAAAIDGTGRIAMRGAIGRIVPIRQVRKGGIKRLPPAAAQLAVRAPWRVKLCRLLRAYRRFGQVELEPRAMVDKAPWQLTRHAKGCA